MKVTLGILAALVVVSWSSQEQQTSGGWQLLPVLSQHYYLPRTFFRQNPPDNWRIDPAAEEEADEDDWQPRRAIKPGQPNHRFFFGANPFLFPTRPLFFTTVYSTSTVSSWITTATVTTCIPSAQFPAASLAAGINTCQRRRRLVPDGQVSPSVVYAYGSLKWKKKVSDSFFLFRVVPSEIPATLEDRKQQLDSSVASSKEEEEEDERPTGDRRLGRAFLGSSNNFVNQQIITLSTTVTSYFFNSTVIKKTISPAIAAAQLGCLPPGMVLC